MHDRRRAARVSSDTCPTALHPPTRPPAPAPARVRRLAASSPSPSSGGGTAPSRQDAQRRQEGPGAGARGHREGASRATSRSTLRANGTVTALQTVDLRSQVTSTVREVHIREGQNVREGRPAVLARCARRRGQHPQGAGAGREGPADLATAQRNLERQRELFNQKFISQAALDTAQNTGRHAAAASSPWTRPRSRPRASPRGYTEIRATFAGRTGTIGVRAGSLVQPGAAAPLVTVTQIDPIRSRFTLPEKELAGLQQALRRGRGRVTAPPQSGGEPLKGSVSLRRQRGGHRHRHHPREGRVRQRQGARCGRACT